MAYYIICFIFCPGSYFLDVFHPSPSIPLNRTEQKIYLLSNIASVYISSEELVFRQTNV